jgi:membrane protease YdiL (CAAX protease family)
MILSFIGFIIVSIVFDFLLGYNENRFSNVIGLFLYACLALWLASKFKKHHVSWKKIVGKLPPRKKGYWIPAIVGLGLLFSYGAAILWFNFMAIISPSLIESILQYQDPLSGTLEEFLIAVVIAPIVEEFIFRGYLLHRWTEKWGVKRAVAFSSILFGLLHFDLFGAMVFGLTMCILYIRTGSLLLTILCHALNNFIVEVISRLDVSMAPTSPLDDIQSMVPAAVALFVLTAVCFLFLLKKYPLGRSPVMPYVKNAPYESFDS